MSESIPVTRFIHRLDACLGRNDMKGARECLVFWEGEARRLGDDRGLLTVLNEAVGYYRRTKKKTRALAAMEESLRLLEKLGQTRSLSGATIYINAATTLSFFGGAEEALPLYGEAAACFEAAGRTGSYEYAALLNNRAAALHALGRDDAAEADWRQAAETLKRLGDHGAEAAISLLMLAQLTYERDGGAGERVEALLDDAWEQINAEGQPRDGNYAYALRKCAPAYDFFQRPLEAQALRDVAGDIYAGRAGE